MGIVLAHGWPFKRKRALRWNFGTILETKNAFFIDGDEDFSFPDGGDKVPQIKRVLIWSDDILVIDTGEDFYYACYEIPKKLVKILKAQKPIDLFIRNPYNDDISHYKGVLECSY